MPPNSLAPRKWVWIAVGIVAGVLFALALASEGNSATAHGIAGDSSAIARQTDVHTAGATNARQLRPVAKRNEREPRFRFGSRTPFVFVVTNVGNAKGVFKGRRKSTLTNDNATVKQHPQGWVRLALSPGESKTVRYRNYCHTNRGGWQRNSLTNMSKGHPIIGVVYVDGVKCRR